MNENGTKRREWIKNVAIIFLVILLLLTFFSNTFMNYSLPEVAAQYVQSGTITAKIRGTGVVESGDPYNVQINETRTVESVMVKAGDTVQKGDILFLLEDKESEELKAAEEALDAAVLEFEKAILSGEISNSVINNVQNGKTSSLTAYQNRILAAEAQIEKQQETVDEAQTKVEQLTAYIKQQGYETPDTTEEAKAVYNAQNAYDTKNEELTFVKTNLSELQTELVAAQKMVRDYESGILNDAGVSGGDAESEYQTAKIKTQKLPEQIQAIQNQITNLQTELYSLNVELEKAQRNLENKKGNTGNINSMNIELENWNLELLARQKRLKEAQDDKAQLLTDIAQELSLDSQSESISKKREEVAKLRTEAIGSAVEAPIGGTITTVSITAGQETKPETPIAVMQPEGKGFTLNFSVTNEQAKKLSPGTKADLVNAWRYEDVEVTLASIKPDPNEPSQKKLLTFDVTGSVTAGQSLNVAVGDKSANYDMIVPNSAVREDNNGKFILIVESKSSPLGNRYVATRVDVEVVASDDTQSAINGGLYGYEFVITTSTKPVEAGQLVRLAEN